MATHVFIEYLVAWAGVHAVMSKKKSACKTAYVIMSQVFEVEIHSPCTGRGQLSCRAVKI